jgi:hypothetical protein
MENDSLKSAWQQMVTEDKSNDELKIIIRRRGHDFLKKIRRQLIIEAISAVAFLIVYYDFFDGDKKPFLANVFLVAALFFMISHNVVSYIQMRSPIKGENIEHLLSDRLYKMKIYAIASAILRLLVACSFLVFFVSVIRFTQVKYWVLSGIIFVFLVQMVLFIKIWNGRIGHLREVIRSLQN